MKKIPYIFEPFVFRFSKVRKELLERFQLIHQLDKRREEELFFENPQTILLHEKIDCWIQISGSEDRSFHMKDYYVMFFTSYLKTKYDLLFGLYEYPLQEDETGYMTRWDRKIVEYVSFNRERNKIEYGRKPYNITIGDYNSLLGKTKDELEKIYRALASFAIDLV